MYVAVKQLYSLGFTATTITMDNAQEYFGSFVFPPVKLIYKINFMASTVKSRNSWR